MSRSEPDSETDPLRELLERSLSGAYRVERELGGGGMARVFLAEEHALGRQVVVKVLSPELAHALSAERFAREIKLSARLQHPNIVPVLAAGAAADVPYYTMPFIQGESLRARLDRLGEGERLPMGQEIDKALVINPGTRSRAFATGSSTYTAASTSVRTGSSTARRSRGIRRCMRSRRRPCSSGLAAKLRRRR